MVKPHACKTGSLSLGCLPPLLCPPLGYESWPDCFSFLPPDSMWIFYFFIFNFFYGFDCKIAVLLVPGWFQWELLEVVLTCSWGEGCSGSSYSAVLITLLISYFSILAVLQKKKKIVMVSHGVMRLSQVCITCNTLTFSVFWIVMLCILVPKQQRFFCLFVLFPLL